MARTTSQRLVGAGVVVTVLGLALSLVAILPLVTPVELPSLFWVLAMVLSVGVGLILAGLAAQGRSRSRLQRTALVRSGSAGPTD